MAGPSIRFYADVVHSYGRGVLRGISDYTKIHDVWDIQFASPPKRGIAQALAQEGIQGTVIKLRSYDQAAELLASGTPAINVSNMLSPLPAMPAIFVDDHAVGRMAAHYFLERGFRNFAFIGIIGHRFSDQRGEGFGEVLRQKGFDFTHLPGGVRNAEDTFAPLFGAQRQSRNEILSNLPHPLALFCANDICGKEMISDVRKLGLRVPDQVAVLGVDNDEIFCDLCAVPLSSIRVDSEQIGYLAAEMLAAVMAGKSTSTEPILVPPIEVITRRSTDLLAVNDMEVANVVRFIRERGGRNINVEDLLSRTRLSRRSLEMRFRKALGRSPHQEIRRVQMERAKVMLSRTEGPLREMTDSRSSKEARQIQFMLGDQIRLAPRQYRRRNHAQLPPVVSAAVAPPSSESE
jgi:LacI family transcriptional regulator